MKKRILAILVLVMVVGTLAACSEASKVNNWMPLPAPPEKGGA